MIHLLWEHDKVGISHRSVWIRSRTFVAHLDEAGNSCSWALPNWQPRHGEEVFGGVREGIHVPLSLALACLSAFLKQCPRQWCHKSYDLLPCREWTLLSGVKSGMTETSEAKCLVTKQKPVLPNVPDCPRSWSYQWFHIGNPDESELSPIASSVQLLGHTILLLK